MKHYRSPNGAVFAYESDGSQDGLIPDGFVALSDAEVQAYVLASSTAPTPEVVNAPPQITEAQAAKLIAFLKANPDIVAAAQL